MFLDFLTQNAEVIGAAALTLILAILTYLTSYIRARGRELEVVQRIERADREQRDASLARIEVSTRHEKPPEAV